MFGMVDTAVMRDRTLPWHTKLIYAYLTTYCSDKRTAWPSRKLIADDTGMCVRSVDAGLKVGVEAGLWTVMRRPNGNGWHSNVYVLRDDPRSQAPEKPSTVTRGGAGDAPPSAGDAPGVVQEMRTNKTSEQDNEEDNLFSRAAARAEMSYDDEDLVDKIVALVEAECGWDDHTAPLVEAMVCRGEPIDYVINTAIKKANEEIPW